MKKNSFLTFCFAMMPGAGQMYVGLMKKGVCLMTLFFGVCLLAVTDIPYMIITVPVLWFYSFFDAINYNNLPIEKKELIKDRLDIDKSMIVFIGLVLILGIIANGIYSFNGLLKLLIFAVLGISFVKISASNKKEEKKILTKFEEESYQN